VRARSGETTSPEGRPARVARKGAAFAWKDLAWQSEKTFLNSGVTQNGVA
jgi:hypothetical protein